MSTLLKTAVVIVLLGISFLCNGQIKQVRYNGEEELKITYNMVAYIGAGDSISDPLTAINYFNASKFIANNNRFLNLGIARDNYWIALEINNAHSTKADLVLNLENPRLNEVDIFTYREDSLTASFRLGDNFPFGERNVTFNQFGFPVLIDKGDSLLVLMLVKHRNNTLQLPISLHTRDSLLKKAESGYLVTGITAGILLLTFFFSIFLFIKSRNRLFLLYALYVLSTFMWLISTEGYGFQYLWPMHPAWATRFGPGFSVFNLCTFIAVALAYTKPYDNTRWLRNTLRGIVLFTLLWGLQAFMPYINTGNTALMSFYLTTSFLVYGITLVLITTYLLYVSLKTNRIVLYYFFTGITSIIFSLLLIAQNSGWINLPLTSGMFISIGLVFEVILMTLGITSQFYQYKKDKEEMLFRYLQQQRSITQQLLDTQEKERKRISREMHDDIGAGLTQIALMSESAKINNNLALQDAIGETCRKLVGNIAEIIWTLNPENKTLSHLCSYLREQLNNQLEYAGIEYAIVLPESEKEIFLSNEQRRNILLVTREIVNNAIKYSAASRISISGELSGDTLRFSVRDDGQGFNMATTSSGNGLKNIRNRIEEISGTIKTYAAPGEGAEFHYSIPLSTT